jgi:GNAT superfamily N-acetyltransferase
MPEPSTEQVGFLTYVAVDVERRGRGIGGALLSAYEGLAREAGLDRLELVTVLGERGAGPFYDRMGWAYAGERVSRSGERYALYVRYLSV